MATILLQARLGSTRLPGKAMKTIMGKPMLHYTVETLKRSPAADRIVMVIPTNPKDDPLVDFAKEEGILWFRGSEENVLERFYRASLRFKDDCYFRATGDNPALDYGNPQRLLDTLVQYRCDYTAEKGMPLGSVVEAFTFDALERCFKEAVKKDDKEHVTLYIKKSGRFNVRFIEAPAEFRYPKLRLTVDYPGDFQRAASIIENLYHEGIPPFKEIIDFAKKNGWI